MSHYPLHRSVLVDGFDINNRFWEAWVSFEKEEEFDEWVANHPYGENVVQVLEKK